MIEVYTDGAASNNGKKDAVAAQHGLFLNRERRLPKE